MAEIPDRFLVHRAAVYTVTGQNAIILRLLERGPQTNVALADVSLKYTSRISDLRAAGYRIVCQRVGHGVTEYRLE